ncbi:MAG: universal stress protein [Candidatus Binatus sp.]|uniref:universal stress protein n=1 Tax=Candidatus Binatus sp. TaxID=2811406 RepID=UPI002724E4D4|nr:universal stress protein [Candidatus Binatus sp.]MDO8434244.1 universal stress protein [Candidatus Binatus sp.]
MSLPYRKILCPVDFDDNSIAALEAAAELARHHDATLYVLHTVPMIVPPTSMPVYVDLYQGQEQTAVKNLQELARKYLAGIKYEIMVNMGEPAGSILKAERGIGADLLVMSTHGRRGFSRFFLGSVAELVLREARCPVLTVRRLAPKKDQVGAWMTRNPVTGRLDEMLSAIHAKMVEGAFRSIPLVQDDRVVAILTEGDIRAQAGHLDDTPASKAVTHALVTVGPDTTVREAARIMRERKIDGLPVVEDGRLVGMITTSDLLKATTVE